VVGGSPYKSTQGHSSLVVTVSAKIYRIHTGIGTWDMGQSPSVIFFLGQPHHSLYLLVMLVMLVMLSHPYLP
jgi:hypothetical protein